MLVSGQCSSAIEAHQSLSSLGKEFMDSAVIVKTDREAHAMREGQLEIIKGLYFISSRFARGFDAKLGKIAYVYYLLFNEDICLGLTDIL